METLLYTILFFILAIITLYFFVFFYVLCKVFYFRYKTKKYKFSLKDDYIEVEIPKTATKEEAEYITKKAKEQVLQAIKELNEKYNWKK